MITAAIVLVFKFIVFKIIVAAFLFVIGFIGAILSMFWLPLLIIFGVALLLSAFTH